MKANFTDFIQEVSNAKKFQNDPTAIFIFEDILSREENIIAMLDASNNDLPALTACINEVENYFDTLSSPTFNLTNDFEKQLVGRMVRVILKPFGFEPKTQKPLPKTCYSRYINSAHLYTPNGEATMKVVRKITEK